VPKRVRFNLQAQPVAQVFAGRETKLALIEQALAANEGAVVTQAIGGLGGVGKSQLAARYVQMHAGEYDIGESLGPDRASSRGHLRSAPTPRASPRSAR
jgi:hypothetical protein